MMVTFVSQCEKNALKKTRRVLDAFANRIGDNTWQTIITEDGLLTVKKMLRQTASKSTAVSCHWIRSRARSQFLWVVGSKSKFNAEGVVPVNSTSQSIKQFEDKVLWKTHKVITHAATIAGLFHDFGKANLLFQKKIAPNEDNESYEPYRHEWISMRLFQAFVEKKSDIEWLDSMENGDFETLQNCLKDGIDGKDGKDEPLPNPLTTLPAFAQLVAWIIVSHHRLPLYPNWRDEHTSPPQLKHIDDWNISPEWNSYHCKESCESQRIIDNWTFKALPNESRIWILKAGLSASKAKVDLQHILSPDSSLNFLKDNIFTGHLARLAMMLADHSYSAQLKVTEEWRSETYDVYANTYRKNEEEFGTGFKQQLDEHLIGVAESAKEITLKLPKLNSSLLSLSQSDTLEKIEAKSSPYIWQNKAVNLIEKLGTEVETQGFFGLNMASTGKGKTIANAKIMYTLGQQTGRVRFSVALGLRTLTLQTGKSFRSDLKLSPEELAIAVGGIAVKQLFENTERKTKESEISEKTGSDSSKSFLDDELYVDYHGEVTHSLTDWTSHDKKKRIDKLLSAPVLVSTIDHLMPATEGVKGGKQIAPMLRLLTSDLIIDEPDDFSLSDLPALCRFVNWAGMLGSKVLLSTATMPPAIANALFQSYQTGWAQFAKANIANWNKHITCAWFDEFATSNHKESAVDNIDNFKKNHQQFVSQRIRELDKEKKEKPYKHIGDILSIDENGNAPYHRLANTIHRAMQLQHKNHHQSDNNKTVSIGLVRMANIKPLVAVAKELLQKSAPFNTCIHYCIYHSKYPLAIRNHIETKLDTILNRKKPEVLWSQRNGVGETLAKHNEQHHIFVVLASPVAEVGRDHDYDWAIIEPSSMRSIIQIAGRVLRHRAIEKPLNTPNILLLNQNYKGINKETPCYERPGFEVRNTLLMENSDLNSILEEQQYQCISSLPRIKRVESVSKSSIGKLLNLNELEHAALSWQLFSGVKKAEVWWKNTPYWCGEVQRQQKFRDSCKDEAYVLSLDGTKLNWQRRNESVYPSKLGEPLINIEMLDDASINLGKNSFFWFEQESVEIYEKLAQDFSLSIQGISEKFGELRVTDYGNASSGTYFYHDQLGLFQEI